MLLAVPPSGFREVEVQELVNVTIKKKHMRTVGMPLEYTTNKSLVWMPYYRIQFEYKRSESSLAQELGETAQSETAMNAMFCKCAQGENEPFMLFRPNHLKCKMMTRSPRPDEIVGPTFYMDSDSVLLGLLTKLNEAKGELNELRSTLIKRYAHFRGRSIVLPVMGDLKEAQKLVEKIAKLSALTNVLSICLNLSENAESITVLHNSIFYYPTLVVALKPTELKAVRFLVIDLVKKGAINKRLHCDDGLTQLCNKNYACGEILTECVAQ